jgi:Flavodoxin
MEMKVTIVYESMYGNTHEIATAIAAGFGEAFDVVVDTTDQVDRDRLGDGLLVVGGPTHVHGMVSSRSRQGAVEAAEKDVDLDLDESVTAPTLRDWLAGLPRAQGNLAVAFDTRLDARAALTGRAAKGIAKRLRRRGYHQVAEPESFLVDKHNRLLPGESLRARAWGLQLAAAVSRTAEPVR